jgi:release factor glutamine methyltransferase
VSGAGAAAGGLAAGEATIARLLSQASSLLAGRAIAAPGLDARLLLAHALGCDQASLIARPGAGVGAAARDAFSALVARRAAREPVSRILGRREFFGREFMLAASVLDPRPDSETAVGVALAILEELPGPPLRICDLGTGSGALLVTLLAECPRATGLGIDIDPAAVLVARANARRLGVAARAGFCVADWAGPVAGTFDLVIANPPYIGRAALAALEPEVREHDPRRALDGGPDGLDGHRAVVAAGRRIADPDGGWLVVEIGADQAGPVARLMSAAGFAPAPPPAGVSHDLAGRARVVAGFRAGARAGQK